MPAFLLFAAGFVFDWRVGIRLLYFFMHLVAPFLFNRCFDFLLSFVGYIGFFMGHLDLGFLWSWWWACCLFLCCSFSWRPSHRIRRLFAWYRCRKSSWFFVALFLRWFDFGYSCSFTGLVWSCFRLLLLTNWLFLFILLFLFGRGLVIFRSWELFVIDCSLGKVGCHLHFGRNGFGLSSFGVMNF